MPIRDHNLANIMSDKLDPLLNPAAHTAFTAAMLSGGSANPLLLMQQVESLLSVMSGGDTLVASQYSNALIITRSLTEQTMLARAAQCSDPAEALGWINAAAALAKSQSATALTARKIAEPLRSQSVAPAFKHGNIITGPDGLPVDEESWDNAARLGAFAAERAQRVRQPQIQLSTDTPAKTVW